MYIEKWYKNIPTTRAKAYLTCTCESSSPRACRHIHTYEHHLRKNNGDTYAKYVEKRQGYQKIGLLSLCRYIYIAHIYLYIYVYRSLNSRMTRVRQEREGGGRESARRRERKPRSAGVFTWRRPKTRLPARFLLQQQRLHTYARGGSLAHARAHTLTHGKHTVPRVFTRTTLGTWSV